MRIDVNAYVGHWPFRQLRGANCRDLVTRLDRFGIDQAWVGNLNGIFYKNCQIANEELAEAAASFPKRLLPWATLNPTYPDWEHDLDVCVNQLGTKGLRLYPQYHGYETGDADCMAIVEAARERGLPVAFTVRMVDERQQSWLDPAKRLEMERIAAVVEKAPDAKYLVLHAYLSGLASEAARATMKKADVLFDTVYGSGVPVGFINAYPLKDAVGAFGADKFAFGTATPFRDYESHILRIETFKEADAQVKAAIYGGNAERFLM